MELIKNPMFPYSALAGIEHIVNCSGEIISRYTIDGKEYVDIIFEDYGTAVKVPIELLTEGG